MHATAGTWPSIRSMFAASPPAALPSASRRLTPRSRLRLSTFPRFDCCLPASVHSDRHSLPSMAVVEVAVVAVPEAVAVTAAVGEPAAGVAQAVAAVKGEVEELAAVVAKVAAVAPAAEKAAEEALQAARAVAAAVPIRPISTSTIRTISPARLFPWCSHKPRLQTRRSCTRWRLEPAALSSPIPMTCLAGSRSEEHTSEL